MRSLTPLLLAALLPATALAASPMELARGAQPNHPRQPQVAVDGKGNIHVVFGIGQRIAYCQSSDGGQTFSRPTQLPPMHIMALGMRRGPRIAALDGALCVTAIGGRQGKGKDGDVQALASTDGGQTWTGPVRVNDVADSAREGLHALAAGPAGELCCTWLDLRHGKTEVMASVSTDSGSTWSKNVLVYRSPDGSVCECCHPSVAFGPRGGIFVLWRNSLDGARDMYVSSSGDGGKTFGEASKLGRGSWPLDACPMDGGAIAVTARGKVASAWRRDNDVYLSLDGQADERRLGRGEQPWIAAAGDGPFVVWLEKRGGIAWLLAPTAKAPSILADHASDPVLASGPQASGPLVAAWEKREGKSHAIYCQVVGP